MTSKKAIEYAEPDKELDVQSCSLNKDESWDKSSLRKKTFMWEHSLIIRTMTSKFV